MSSSFILRAVYPSYVCSKMFLRHCLTDRQTCLGMIDLGDVSRIHVHHRHESVYHLHTMAAPSRRLRRFVHRMVIVIIVYKKSWSGDCLWLGFGVRLKEYDTVFDEISRKKGDEDVKNVAERHASQNTAVRHQQQVGGLRRE